MNNNNSIVVAQGNFFSDVPDFNKVLHTRENNPESQAHLEANKYHFVGQCAIVYSLLKAGVVLSTRIGQLNYNIGDLRARIRDLMDAGVRVDKVFEMDEKGKKTRFKKYFMYETISEQTAIKHKIEWKKKQ